MIEELEPSPPAKAATTVAAADALDFSAEIVGHLEREPADRVTCRRVFDDYYRCNWWAPASKAGYDNPAMYGLTVTTHRVRKSEFLRVSRTTNGLTITPRGRE
jgi:hypothetical protein